MSRAKPTLLIISFSDISADARVLKQIALFRDRFDLYTCGHGPAPDGAARHFEIPAECAIWKYDRFAVMARQYRRAYWGNPAIVLARAALSGHELDAVLANDVDAVGLALALKPRYGVHADLHEYAPRQKEELRRWKLFVAPFMAWMCREFVAKASSTTTVGQGIADEYKKVFGFSPAVVTNAAPFAELHPTRVQTPISLVHSGASLRDRGISELVDAVEASRTDVRLHLYLTRNDPSFVEEIRGRARESSRVTLHDPVPYSELMHTLNGHDIGVHLLPPVSFNNAWALPNKFFDYVQARLGVLIGPSPEMARLLDEYKLGAVSKDFSAAALTTVLDELTESAVSAWKAASNEAAFALSAQVQVGVWDDAITSLMSSPTAPPEAHR